jgi:uncharacterized protein involved in outer membrane biogenesis
VLAVAGLAALTMAGPFDLAPIAARHMARSLGRPVAIETMRVHFGAAVRVELRGLVFDNVDGGSQPRMLEVGRIDAETTPWSLILWALPRHALTVRHLSVEGVRLLLERGAGDRPNWRFGDSGPSKSDRRGGFPALLDARIRDAEIDVRPSSGHTLRVRLDEAGIAAGGVGQPISLAGTGAYNATPIALTATLRSFNELHDAALPFGMELHFSSGETTLGFVGTMTDPLNVDGADGRLALNAPTWDRVLAIAGIGEWAGRSLARGRRQWNVARP